MSEIEMIWTPLELRRGAAERSARKLVGEAAAAVHGAEATLWLTSESGELMLAAINHGPASDLVEALEVPVGDSVVGMVASMGISMSIGPEDHHNETVDKATGVSTRAMVAALVELGGSQRGVLSAINPAEGEMFDGDMLAELEWKAYLLGLVLQDLADD